MNFDNFNWKNDYNKFLDYLFSLEDLKYKDFNSNVTKTDKSIIGIRIPLLKKIAKEISKYNYFDFIKYNKHDYYEEIVLHGLVITCLKEDFKYTLTLFDDYIDYIESWASCDSVVCNYKSFSKNLEIGFIKIKKYLNSFNPWKVRVGLVLLLDYYLNDQYIDEVLKLSDSVKVDDYYVKMANAWLLSMCLVKYYDKTLSFLKKCNLDDWTYNKALTKAIESYRIKNKDQLRKEKRIV